MTTNIWGSDAAASLILASDFPALGSTLFDAADSGGAEVGLIYIRNGQVIVTFLDELGNLSAARPTVSLTSGIAPVSEVAITATGVLGYAAAWIDAATSQIKVQYFGSAGVYGSALTLGTGHGLDMAGYFVDDTLGRKPVVDGFAATWIGTDGNVYFQRAGVFLNSKVDPVGVVSPAGVDGIPAGAPAGTNVGPNTDADAPLKIDVNGLASQTTVTVTHDGEIALAWTVHGAGSDTAYVTVLNSDGTQNFAASLPGTIPAGAHIDTAWLAGGGFVVAWNTENSIKAVVFGTAGGAVPGIGAVFTTAGAVTLESFDAGNFNGNFSLGTMLDSIGGFTLSFADGNQLKEHSFNALAGLLDPAQTQPITLALIDPNSGLACAGLAGDRVLIVSEQPDGSINGTIVDPRAQASGLPITLNGSGLLLNGTDTATRVVGDLLVGSIGNDTLNGGAGADTMDGALGHDRIIAGLGNDLVDGGGGSDTLVLTGTQADYTVVHLGGTLFSITDNRPAGIGDGLDLVRNVEFFDFAGETPLAARVVVNVQVEYLNNHPNTTPTAWGLTNVDSDSLPSVTRGPDVDGFIVNDGADRAGNQSGPVVSDSVGEFVSILWEDHSGGGSHIRGNFYDVLGNPDTGTPLPNTVSISDGHGYEFAPVVASGGANSGWGVVYSELRADGTEELKTNFFSLNLTSAEQAVDATGLNQHDAAVFGSYLDHKLNPATGVVEGPDVILPAAMNDGYNVVYVEGAQNQAYGAIRLQRFEVALDALGNPGATHAAGIDGLAGVGSDAAVTLAANGRDPSITGLHTFETIAVWIEKDGNGAERVSGTALDDTGQPVPISMSNISQGDVIAAGSKVTVAQAGAVNAAVVWVADVGVNGDHVYQLRATMYSSPGTGLDGQGFALGAPAAPFTLMTLPAGVDLASVVVSGISGEGSNDIIVQWDGLSGMGDSNIFARHIGVTLDPTTGIALDMSPVGDVIQVNANGQGTQSHGGVAGLLSDRFISVWQDNGSAVTGTNGSDIVAQIYDTRDPNHDPAERLIGDFIRPGTSIVQPRRDIIVGTIGNDYIQGDIGDAKGLADQLYGGLGNDTLLGGPSERLTATFPEILDGGEGIDTAVYTGNFANYDITPVFDNELGAGFQISDLRSPTDAAGQPVQHDGVDLVFHVEKLVFADQVIDVTTDIFSPAKPEPLAGFDGTPQAWSLTDESAEKLQTLASGDQAQSQIDVTNLQDDAAMVWVSGNAGEASHSVMAVRYTITGEIDPLWQAFGQPAAGAVELTDGTFAQNTVTDPTVAMAGGLGLVGAWTSTDPAGESSIHLRFGSTATNTPFDVGAGFPAYGLAGAELVVPGSGGGHAPALRGYEIVDGNNDTVEIGFHVAFVDDMGNVRLARYEIPVYDVDPVTGALGAPTTPANFGKGAETQPVLIGADGLRDRDGSGALIDDPNGAINLGQGSGPSMTSLHNGELVLGFVDASGHFAVTRFDVAQTADSRDAAAFVTGTISYVPAPTDSLGGNVVWGQVVAQQNGSFGAFWTEHDDDGHNVVKGDIYQSSGAGWTPTGSLTLATDIPAGAEVAVVSAGVDPNQLETGFVVLWQIGGHIAGQRFDMAGTSVGQNFSVDDPDGVAHLGLSAAGIDNGLILVGHELQSGNGDVGFSYLDTRQPGAESLGPRSGVAFNVAVGTTGDDAMDGRAGDDQLFAGLGNDVITLGDGADVGDGGAGNDIVLGGRGQDQLLGGLGNDLLLPGSSGPADPKTDKALIDGLTAAGITAAVLATDGGADVVAGGGGIDTLSFRQEPGAVRIDLLSGLAYRAAVGAGTTNFTDHGVVGSYKLTAALGTLVDDGAGGQIFQFSHDVERAEGGRGADVLLGDGGDNVVIGGGGNDFIDGRAGVDMAVFKGAAAGYSIVQTADGVAVFHTLPATATTPATVETVQLTGVEFLQFGDRRVASADVPAGPAVLATSLTNCNPAPILTHDTFTVDEDTTATFNVVGNDQASEFAPLPVHVTAIDGHVISVAGPAVAVAGGSVTLGAEGQLNFTPTENFFGQTSFTYTADDGGGVPSTATVDVTVSPVADAPTAVDDTYEVVLGTTVNLDVIANDINLDGPISDLSVLALDVANLAGQATANGQTITFTADTVGMTSLTYTVSNGLESAPATVTIKVVPHPNSAPDLTGDLAAAGNEGAVIALTEADIGYVDADGDALTYTTANAVNGVVQVNGIAASSFTASDLQAGHVTFVHDGSETTAASFTLAVTDGKVVTTPVTVELAITPVNDAPIVTGTSGPATYVENAAPMTIAPALTLSDVDSPTLSGATVTVSGARPEDVLSFTARPGITGSFAAGALVLSGTASLADYQAVLRSVAYANTSDRPDTAARTISFTVNDGGDVNATAGASAQVAVQGVNDAATGAVSIAAATGLAASVTLTAVSTLQDADLANPTPLTTFNWLSSSSLAGSYAAAGTGASLTATPAAITFYQVSGRYTDPFGQSTVSSVDRAVVGTTGGNAISTTGVNFLAALGGTDTITYVATSKAGLVIDGGDGVDLITIGTGTASFAPLSDGQLIRIEQISASSLSTAVTINVSNQTEAFQMTGGNGADTIVGGRGADTINGGNGNDLIRAIDTDGNDSVVGGAGIDTLDYSASTGTLTVNLVAGSIIGSTTGTDTVSQVETVIGTGTANSMTGDTAANRFEGLAGNDTLQGGDGNDTVLGGANDDFLFGNAGLDVLTGGQGADRFVFNTATTASVDTITDFTVGQDKIQITAAAFQIGAGPVGAWLSTTGTFTTINQRIAYDAATGQLTFDSNGSAAGGNRFQIGLVDMNDNAALHPVLTLSDFVLA